VRWSTASSGKGIYEQTEAPRRLADADVGMFGAESSPSRSAPIALVVVRALRPGRLAAGARRRRQADARSIVAERANKWIVRPFRGLRPS